MKKILTWLLKFRKPIPAKPENKKGDYIRITAYGFSNLDFLQTPWYKNTPENLSQLKDRRDLMLKTDRYVVVSIEYGIDWHTEDRSNTPRPQIQGHQPVTYKTQPR